MKFNKTGMCTQYSIKYTSFITTCIPTIVYWAEYNQIFAHIFQPMSQMSLFSFRWMDFMKNFLLSEGEKELQTQRLLFFLVKKCGRWKSHGYIMGKCFGFLWETTKLCLLWKQQEKANWFCLLALFCFTEKKHFSKGALAENFAISSISLLNIRISSISHTLSDHWLVCVMWARLVKTYTQCRG